MTGVVAVVGTVVLLRGLAAGVPVGFEAEVGSVQGPAVKQALSGASAGSVVKFGPAVPTPAPGGSLSQVPANPKPTVETATFSVSGDIADDSAIYADPSNPANSVVIGDNKDSAAGGIGVFNMQGAMIQFRKDGKIGNVDLRTGFVLGGRSIVLVGANNRTNDSLIFWELNPSTRQLSAPIGLGTKTVASNYGFCFYKSPVTGKFYAFVTQETGSATMEQYELFDSAGKVGATKVRSFNVGSITEGCVADDDLGRLYVAQEDVGLWRYDAEPSGGAVRTQIGKVGDGHLTADVEGVAIAKGPNKTGYIVVSSQGDNRYAIYDRQTNAFMRNFSIGANGSIDAVSQTDGLDISTANLGPGFEKGALVVHDGSNTGSATSNLKYIPLE